MDQLMKIPGADSNSIKSKMPELAEDDLENRVVTYRQEGFGKYCGIWEKTSPFSTCQNNCLYKTT
jgi:hypothetical protein